MAEKEKDAEGNVLSIQERELMVNIAEVLALEGMISPKEKAGLLMYIREDSVL